MTKTDEGSFVICHNHKMPYKVQTETKHGSHFTGFYGNKIHSRFEAMLALNREYHFYRQ